jgi:hypothetical protein
LFSLLFPFFFPNDNPKNNNTIREQINPFKSEMKLKKKNTLKNEIPVKTRAYITVNFAECFVKGKPNDLDLMDFLFDILLLNALEEKNIPLILQMKKYNSKYHD